jgi:S1-C subfamily serine protease
LQLPDAIDRIRCSVVQIERVSDGPPQTVGTGFVVARDGDLCHVVTANHVVEEIDSGAGERLNVAFAMPDVVTPEISVRAGFIGTGASVVEAVADKDLALLKVINSPGALAVAGRPVEAYRTPARLSTSQNRDGVALAVSGYPLAEPSLVTNAGVLASTFSMEGEQELLLGDFTANPGNSGGPIYTVSDAQVVGVCTAGRLAPLFGGTGAYAAGLTLIVPAAEVAALLDRNGLTAAAARAALPERQRRKGGKRRRRG